MIEKLFRLVLIMNLPRENIFLIICIILCFISHNGVSYSQTNTESEQKIQNVIFMIPDGTSTPVLSLARWYQWYHDNSKKRLAVDSIICGLVKTHSSNALIGGSAPTASCFSTGYKSQAGFIAMYPPEDHNDLIYIHPDSAYQPLLTILEAAKLSGKSTGMVVTSDFTDATPASFSAHYYNRKNWRVIARQIVYNNIDLVYGVGDTLLGKTEYNYLINNGTEVVHDYDHFKKIHSLNRWALFGSDDMKFDIDRDTLKVPSLAEMTCKALSILEKNSKKGFFLLVEGSRIDWAAHKNDPLGVITEYLAFDKAVDIALQFARKDGETVIIICPDHGNSGISLGNHYSDDGYNKVTIDALVSPLKECKLTAEGLTEKIYEKMETEVQSMNQDSIICSMFRQYWGIEDLEKAEVDLVLNAVKKKKNKKNYENAIKIVAGILTSRTYIGFTTTQHTGEDVFLAIYTPCNFNRPEGLVEGGQLNQYLCKILGIASLNDSTYKYLSPHREVFKSSEKYIDKIVKQQDDIVLQISRGKDLLEVSAYKNIAFFNHKPVMLKTVVVYVDKNETFYLPRYLKQLFEKK
jgi:alkaline phosphatase